MTNSEAVAVVEGICEFLNDLVDGVVGCAYCGSAAQLKDCKGCGTRVCAGCRPSHAHATSGDVTEPFIY